MDVAAVRLAVSNAVDEISGLICTPYRPDSITEPAFFVGEVEVEYDETMGRGYDKLTLTAYLLVSRADDKSSQAALDAYLAGHGSSSVKAALYAVRGVPGTAALGGAASSCRLVRAYDYGFDTYGSNTSSGVQGQKYLGVTFQIDVYGRGDA